LNGSNPPPIMVAPFRLHSPEEGERGGEARTAQPRSLRRRRSRRRSRLLAVSAVILIVLVALAVGAAVRLRASAPVASVTATMAPSIRVASAPVVMPWPAMGQSAVAVPAIGIHLTSGPEEPVPIASLTKMMTAYVVLHDHPLGPGQDGPGITMTQTDVGYFDDDTVDDEANAQVAAGEVLTERQLLEGLLVHSANNYADSLARWDAGGIPAFVDKMNRFAGVLGMDHTHYADPSGFDQASVSTAGDLLKVAAPDMADATFADIVRMPAVTLPVAGTISTYTPLLGVDGVIGVKSGFTTAAGGCDVVAVDREVSGHSVLILGAVTGQNGPNVLATAALMALNLADHAYATIGSSPLVRAGEIVARVSAAGKTVVARAGSTADVLSWPGVTAERVLVDERTIRAGAEKGTIIGSVVVLLGEQRDVIPVVLSRHLPEPTVFQRLF
jgi:serine-type D-Ala-D-Ala carboxypeptidase (penicillin-binding protein 5/6)